MTDEPLTAPGPDDLADIQGLVYSAWTDHRHAGFLFARLGDDARAGRAWLDDVRRRVTPAARHRRGSHGRLQLALSATGLTALGVPADVIDMMAPEATAGMASRDRVLADIPAAWQLGGPADRLDALVMVYARDAATRDAELGRHRAALVAAGATVRPDELAFPMGEREHFGFADGLSQPHVPGFHAAPRPGEDAIPAGEIVLGYPNAYGQLPLTPLWDHFDLGKNGSYLVFRKLGQDVAGLWSWIARHARALAGPAASPADLDWLTDWLAAKLVGRWRSGAPLALTPDRDDPALATPARRNAFEFLAHDPDGLRCPLSAHIRRANPRDARGGSADDSRTVVGRHRILRRGRSYGSPLPHLDALAGRDDGAARGLYFICLQSSIARGFEFIQQTWLANPGFLGLHDEPDPLLGGSAGKCHFTIPADPVRLRLSCIPTVVTSHGGGYFFLPSLAALARIAAGP